MMKKYVGLGPAEHKFFFPQSVSISHTFVHSLTFSSSSFLYLIILGCWSQQKIIHHKIVYNSLEVKLLYHTLSFFTTTYNIFIC